MKKGHRARECEAFDVLCNKCGQVGHHISLCDVKIVQSVQNKTPIATTGSPNRLHKGMGGGVALQTACAVIYGEGEPYRVRVLSDAGSHRSLITSKAAQSMQLARIRQEWLGISTFGQRSKDMRLRDVVEVKVSPVGGQKVIPIKGYVVPEISSIQSGHVEFVKGEYPHLKDLWFFGRVCGN